MKKTFSLGGVHPCDSKLSSESAIEVFPLPKTVYISMSQHLGAPAEPVVAAGDKVKVGTVIGKPSGFMSAFVHSSVSGTVKAVEPYPDLSGKKVLHVIIDVEGDEWEPSATLDSPIDGMALSPEEIIEKVKNAGVVGLGGAAFPTHIKLSPPPGKKAEFVILNGTECEPYLTSDDRLMREHPDKVIAGAKLLMKAIGVTKGYVGIEDNKKAAIKAMKKEAAACGADIRVVTLKKKYPQGGEKQLIDAVVGRRVPSKGLPIDAGAIVQNVGTAVAVYEAVCLNKPLVDNILSVTGAAVAQPRNFLVRVGTPLSALIEACGGLPDGNVKVISGGPMMGKAISCLDAATLKATSSVLILTEAETVRKPAGNCIRCGKCADACPMGLQPFLIGNLTRYGGNLDALEAEHIYDCIECGCCLYTCPAQIPLLDVIRVGKAEVMKYMRSRNQK